MAASTSPTTGTSDIPLVYSIDYVKAHLKELHGRHVRVHGQINECASLTCLICTGPEATATCLPISIAAGEPARKSDDDVEGSRREERSSDLIETLYRFATVTADVTVDATCELGYDPTKASDQNETIVCTDRSNALDDAHIVSVDVRRSATEGRFDAYEGAPLRDATNVEARPVLNAWIKQWRALNPKGELKQAPPKKKLS